jgi:hypothetical protein
MNKVTVRQHMKQYLPKIFLALFVSMTLAGPLSAAEAKADEAKADEAKADNAKADDATADEAKADNAKADNAKADDAKADDAKADDAKADDAKADDAKADDAKADEVKADDAKADDAKAEAAPSEDVDTKTPEPVQNADEADIAPETAPNPAAQNAAAMELDEPTTAESKTIAWVFAGITAASLAGGVYAGLQAQEQFNCLSDVLTCNDSRDTPIENEDFLKAKSDLDRITLVADMGFLTAVVTGTVTIAAIVRAMDTEPTEEQAPLTSMLTLPQE